jgi:hypothetical protein
MGRRWARLRARKYLRITAAAEHLVSEPHCLSRLLGERSRSRGPEWADLLRQKNVIHRGARRHALQGIPYAGLKIRAANIHWQLRCLLGALNQLHDFRNQFRIVASAATTRAAHSEVAAPSDE